MASTAFFKRNWYVVYLNKLLVKASCKPCLQHGIVMIIAKQIKYKYIFTFVSFLDAIWRKKDIHNTIYTMIHSSSKHICSAKYFIFLKWWFWIKDFCFSLKAK